MSTDDATTQDAHPRSFDSAFRSQFGGDELRFGRRSRRGDSVDESKEEMDLQESKEDSESENDVMEVSTDESGEDESAVPASAAEGSDVAVSAETIEGGEREPDIPVPTGATGTTEGTRPSSTGNNDSQYFYVLYRLRRCNCLQAIMKVLDCQMKVMVIQAKLPPRAIALRNMTLKYGHHFPEKFS